MNVAVNIDNTSQSIHNLDLEEEEDFKLRLRSWCGLFVSIHHGKVYFLHQTAREFLLADLPSSTTVPRELQWHNSITIHHAHTILAELCVRYLNFFSSNANLLIGTTLECNHHIHSHAFLDYSAEFWALHFREACISNDDAAIVPLALRICDPDSIAYWVWFRIYEVSRYTEMYQFFTGLLVVSYFGHSAVVKLLLKEGPDLESRDDYYGRTPLSWAAENGYQAVVKPLLEEGADLESRDNTYGRTPLSRAAENGHEAVIKLLLEEGADSESRDNMYGKTPLSWAVYNGHEAVAKLLLEEGADLESRDTMYGQISLSRAAGNGNEALIKLLLKEGADLESRDTMFGRTPLLWAAENGHESVIKLLLEEGTDLESRENNYNQILLSQAV